MHDSRISYNLFCLINTGPRLHFNMGKLFRRTSYIQPTPTPSLTRLSWCISLGRICSWWRWWWWRWWWWRWWWWWWWRTYSVTWGQVGIYVGLSAMIKLEIHSNAAFSECASQTYHFLLTEFPGVLIMMILVMVMWWRGHSDEGNDISQIFGPMFGFILFKSKEDSLIW